MTDQELFEKLKRDGECWHKLPVWNDTMKLPEIFRCIKCHRIMNDIMHKPINPDFSTPDGFFWLWERAQEKEWWDDFFSPYDPWGIEELIHRTKFTEALKQYLGESNG